MPAPSFLVDRREIVSGLGDRVANLLCVAALARAVGMSCVVRWRNDPRQPHRHYAWQRLRPFLQLPDGVHVVDDVDAFDFGGAARVELQAEGNALPATQAYDCVYTLAHRALAVAQHPVDAARMAACYRAVCAQWDIRLPGVAAPPAGPYIALHLRGTDKMAPTLLFHTARVLRALLPQMPVVAVSDDERLLAWCRRRFPGVRHVRQGQVDADLAPLQDWQTLLGARAIVQHAQYGWSAFSSVAAMARGIPLLNTYALRRRNLLADFERHQGLPPELRSAAQPGAVRDFVDAVRSMADAGEAQGGMPL